MADKLTKCPACDGRGYFHCDCWPGDCICGQDEETCFECDGDGWIDQSYDNFDGNFVTPPLPTAPSKEGSTDE